MSGVLEGGVGSAAAGSPQRTVSQVLGEITWLLTQSPVHRMLFISDLEWAVMPALLLEQFRIFYAQDKPAALVLWASVSADTAERLRRGQMKLRPDEWRSGDRLWLVEMVAPFGGQDEILADCARTVFGGKPFKYQRTGPDGAEIVEHPGQVH